METPGFGFCHSDFFCHSKFVIRHSLPSNTTFNLTRTNEGGRRREFAKHQIPVYSCNMLFPPGLPQARSIFALLATGLLLTARLGAVESNGSYVTTAPTVANWNTGWGSGSVTGWDYLGQVGGATGVYLGNNWVLTADHVTPGDFTLNGITYSPVAGSSHSIISGGTPVDLRLFQIASGPNLPLLKLAGTSLQLVGTNVVMTGFGVDPAFGSQAKTWGENSITNDNIQVTIQGYPYTSVDFETVYGGGNQSVLYVGDSGGGDFIYSHGKWLLAGINEALDGNNSYMVQVGEYASLIDPIVAVPEPDAALLTGLGFSLVMLCRRTRRLA
jgi:hypothetical protein